MHTNISKISLIPVNLLELAIYENIVPQVRIYLWLKTHSSGSIKPDYRQLQQHLKISDQRTFNKHLNWLIANHWINQDKQGIIYIRSYKRIFKYYNLKTSTGTYLPSNSPQILSLKKVGDQIKVRYKPGIDIDPEAIFSNNKTFKAFACAASISLMLRYQRRRRKNGKKSTSTNLRHAKLRGTSRPSYYGLANSLIAERLQVSKSQVSNLKHEAKSCGFIRIKKHNECLGELGTGIPKELSDNGYYAKEGKLYRRLYDEMSSFLNLKSIRKQRLF